MQQDPKSRRERAEDLIRLLVPDWQPTPWQGLWAIRIGIVLGLLVAIGYSYGVTLWDWIKLLIVPAAIAGAGLWFNQQQREREQRIADNRAQDDSLQAYLDGMSQLLTDTEQPLHSAQPGDSLSTIARARTLTVLGRLDGGRKRSVMQFLYEAGLIRRDRALVDLTGADLREAYLRGARLLEADLGKADLVDASLMEANLSGAYLSGANLTRADLSGAATNLIRANLFKADLHGANLRGANLSGANLRGAELFMANLSGAYLSGANLTRASLMEANLFKADLLGADLSRANLSGANLSSAQGWTEEQLSEARTLRDATMPDGQILQGDAVPDGPTFEEWLKSQGRKEDAENE